MSSLPQSDSPTSNPPDHCGANLQQQKTRPGAPVRRTRRWFLFGGSALILLAAIFWRPLQQHCLAYVLLRSEAPSEEVLSAALEPAGDPASLLTALWKTYRIPHRRFVLNYLARASASKPDLLPTMDHVIIEATRDPDVETREAAFEVLSKAKHSQLRRLALEQLGDKDPAVRLLGLQTLRSAATSNEVPIAFHLLADPEPRVVVAAALLLRHATGEDFGIRTAHALPQFIGIDTNPPPPPDLPAISRGVQRWRDWWQAHQADYSPFPALPPPSPRVSALPARDFTLPDSAGKPFRLSDYRGKRVLLAFWNWATPFSLDGLSSLQTIQVRNPDRLAVFGICVPPAPSCAEEDEHSHEHAHHHHAESAGTGTGAEHMRCFVQDAATRLKLNYSMLMDATGEIGLRFKVEDLPVYVLIDADGTIRRRFVGIRTESALAAVVEEVVTPSAVRASANFN